MLDVTLMQLQMFVAVVEAGSISAAARRLGRVQSAVSQGIAALEDALGVEVLDRSGRNAIPTPAGERLVVEAGRVLTAAHRLQGLARELAGDVEPVVSVVVDVMLDVNELVPVLRGFRERWPEVQLLVHSEALDAVAARVLDGSCVVGVGGPLSELPSELEVHGSWKVRMVPVAAPTHPLATRSGVLTTEQLRRHPQIVLTHRSRERGANHFVVAEQTWRVADLSTKRTLIVWGLGWGSLPEHVVADDLRAGRLVPLRPEPWQQLDGHHGVGVLTHRERPPGPAGRWLLEQLVARHDPSASDAPSPLPRRST